MQDALYLMARESIDNETYYASRAAGIKRAHTALAEISHDYDSAISIFSAMERHISIWDDVATEAALSEKWTIVIYAKVAMKIMRDQLNHFQNIRNMLQERESDDTRS